MYKVAVFVGSLRADSMNLKLAKALETLGKGAFDCHFVQLSDVPIYNEDLWENPPAGVTRLKKDIEGADAVLFITPEYNRSIPAVIKNAIDWGTRPYGKNSWIGKPAAIAGASPGAVGTAVAQSHLRSIVSTIGLSLLNTPELYFSFKPDAIDANGNVSNDDTRAFLKKFMDAFEAGVKKFREGAASA
jgi:chromate reductase